MLVELTDGETGRVYTIDVTEQEAERIEYDIEFAQECLELCQKRDTNNSNMNMDMAEDVFEEDTMPSPTVPDRRRLWSYDEILKLISSIESHYRDLQSANPTMKKKAWQNITNDLASSKIVVPGNEVKKKWANLVQSYNKAKDRKVRTGEGPTRFHFFNKMDEILGYKPSNSSPYSVDAGSAITSDIKIVTKNLSREKIQDKPVTKIFPENVEDVENIESPLCTTTPTRSGPSHNVRKRKNPTQEYMNIKKNFLQRREELLEKSHTEKLKNNEKKELHNAEKLGLLKKKLELEERKIKVLENFLALKGQEKY